MANFARIEGGRVVGLHSVKNIDMMTEYGIEVEEMGVERLQRIHGDYTFKQCSINTAYGVHRSGRKAIRKNMPAVGWYYNEMGDFFYPPRPTDMNGVECSSWSLDEEIGRWVPPIEDPQPTYSLANRDSLSHYEWDEAAYQADNTQGWTLVTPE